MSDTKYINVTEAAELLLGQDNILIVTHRNPDGDTLGCGYSLWAALLQKGKNARVLCPSKIPAMYSFLTDKYDSYYSENDVFSPSFIVSVDTAAPSLMGKSQDLAEITDLSIDHHGSNTGYAKKTLIAPSYPSCAELIYELFLAMDIDIDSYIAAALYTGISTDTGCYLFRNVNANSHAVTAKLIERGIDVAALNRILFETKSRALLALERMAIDTLEFYYNDRIAIITVSEEMMSVSGAEHKDMTSITPLTLKIEGVEAGITFRILESGNVKCSLRTTRLLDASVICSQFGGGGHIGASGFECSGNLQEIKALLIRAIISEFERKEKQGQ